MSLSSRKDRENSGGDRSIQGIVVGYGENGRVKVALAPTIGSASQENTIECTVLGSPTTGSSAGTTGIRRSCYDTQLRS